MTTVRLLRQPNKNVFFFFLRLVGRPGKYLYVVGSYRMEEVMQTGKTIFYHVISWSI